MDQLDQLEKYQSFVNPFLNAADALESACTKYERAVAILTRLEDITKNNEKKGEFFSEMQDLSEHLKKRIETAENITYVAGSIIESVDAKSKVVNPLKRDLQEIEDTIAFYNNPSKSRAEVLADIAEYTSMINQTLNIVDTGMIKMQERMGKNKIPELNAKLERHITYVQEIAGNILVKHPSIAMIISNPPKNIKLKGLAEDIITT